jgi:hypothetical protein
LVECSSHFATVETQVNCDKRVAGGKEPMIIELSLIFIFLPFYLSLFYNHVHFLHHCQTGFLQRMTDCCSLQKNDVSSCACCFFSTFCDVSFLPCEFSHTDQVHQTG